MIIKKGLFMKRKFWDVMVTVFFLAAVLCASHFGLRKAAASGAKPTESETQENCGIIVIDPGHGGIDPGKVGINNIRESDINLQISLRLKSVLKKDGYKVILTRESEEGLYDENDVNKKASDMRKRCEIIEKSKADIAVSIHQNSFSEESVKGAQVFYYKHSAEGKKLAELLQKSLKDNADPDNNRECKSNDSYYMLIHTPCPTVIAECGFLSNSEEAGLLSDESYQDTMAHAIADGIEEYYLTLAR